MIKIQILKYKIFETTITNLLPGTQLSCTWCILRPLLVGENLQSVQGENVITQDFKRTSICQSYVDVSPSLSCIFSPSIQRGWGRVGSGGHSFSGEITPSEQTAFQCLAGQLTSNDASKWKFPQITLQLAKKGSPALSPLLDSLQYIRPAGKTFANPYEGFQVQKKKYTWTLHILLPWLKFTMTSAPALLLNEPDQPF